MSWTQKFSNQETIARRRPTHPIAAFLLCSYIHAPILDTYSLTGGRHSAAFVPVNRLVGSCISLQDQLHKICALIDKLQATIFPAYPDQRVLLQVISHCRDCTLRRILRIFLGEMESCCATRVMFFWWLAHTLGITISANSSCICWNVLSPVCPSDHCRSV